MFSLPAATRFMGLRPGRGLDPTEFVDAAYRYGHSQVLDRYQVNRHAEPVPPGVQPTVEAWASPSRQVLAGDDCEVM